jgi:hypothetical protein
MVNLDDILKQCLAPEQKDPTKRFLAKVVVLLRGTMDSLVGNPCCSSGGAEAKFTMSRLQIECEKTDCTRWLDEVETEKKAGVGHGAPAKAPQR